MNDECIKKKKQKNKTKTKTKTKQNVTTSKLKGYLLVKNWSTIGSYLEACMQWRKFKKKKIIKLFKNLDSLISYPLVYSFSFQTH